MRHNEARAVRQACLDDAPKMQGPELVVPKSLRHREVSPTAHIERLKKQRNHIRLTAEARGAGLGPGVIMKIYNKQAK